uniref:G_PROTEIN_RECEP_F1_2 domain-containing protein n=1 Tax=Rhabditophanes sp. KR3021 TaxID=114890 RepID=A0AC35TPV7_9BILA
MANLYIYRLKQILSIKSTIVLFSGTFLNILLFYICYSIKCREFKDYKRVIYLFVLTDLLYNAIQFINKNVAEHKNGYYIFISHGLITNFGQEIVLVSVIAETRIFLYLVITKRIRLTKFKFILLILFNIAWNLTDIIWLYSATFNGLNEACSLVESFMPIEFALGTDNATLPFFPIKETEVINILVLCHILLTCITVFLGITIILMKIQRKFKETSNFISKNTKKLQKQLTVTMCIHFMMPILLFAIPTTFILGCITFGVDPDKNAYGHIIFMFIIWPIVLNPLCTIILIGPCCKMFCSIFRLNCFRKIMSREMSN